MVSAKSPNDESDAKMSPKSQNNNQAQSHSDSLSGVADDQLPSGGDENDNKEEPLEEKHDKNDTTVDSQPQEKNQETHLETETEKEHNQEEEQDTHAQDTTQQQQQEEDLESNQQQHPEDTTPAEQTDNDPTETQSLSSSTDSDDDIITPSIISKTTFGSIYETDSERKDEVRASEQADEEQNQQDEDLDEVRVESAFSVPLGEDPIEDSNEEEDNDSEKRDHSEEDSNSTMNTEQPPQKSPPAQENVASRTPSPSGGPLENDTKQSVQEPQQRDASPQKPNTPPTPQPQNLYMEPASRTLKNNRTPQTQPSTSLDLSPAMPSSVVLTVFIREIILSSDEEDSYFASLNILYHTKPSQLYNISSRMEVNIPKTKQEATNQMNQENTSHFDAERRTEVVKGNQLQFQSSSFSFNLQKSRMNGEERLFPGTFHLKLWRVKGKQNAQHVASGMIPVQQLDDLLSDGASSARVGASPHSSHFNTHSKKIQINVLKEPHNKGEVYATSILEFFLKHNSGREKAQSPNQDNENLAVPAQIMSISPELSPSKRKQNGNGSGQGLFPLTESQDSIQDIKSERHDAVPKQHESTPHWSIEELQKDLKSKRATIDKLLDNVCSKEDLITQLKKEVKHYKSRCAHHEQAMHHLKERLEYCETMHTSTPNGESHQQKPDKSLQRELFKLKKAYKQQGKSLSKAEEKAKKLDRYKNICSTQEKVIEKLEKVIQSNMKIRKEQDAAMQMRNGIPSIPKSNDSRTSSRSTLYQQPSASEYRAESMSRGDERRKHHGSPPSHIQQHADGHSRRYHQQRQERKVLLRRSDLRSPKYGGKRSYSHAHGDNGSLSPPRPTRKQHRRHAEYTTDNDEDLYPAGGFVEEYAPEEKFPSSPQSAYRRYYSRNGGTVRTPSVEGSRRTHYNRQKALPQHRRGLHQAPSELPPLRNGHSDHHHHPAPPAQHHYNASVYPSSNPHAEKKYHSLLSENQQLRNQTKRMQQLLERQIRDYSKEISDLKIRMLRQEENQKDEYVEEEQEESSIGGAGTEELMQPNKRNGPPSHVLVGAPVQRIDHSESELSFGGHRARLHNGVKKKRHNRRRRWDESI